MPGPDSERWQVAGRVLNYRAILDMGWSDTEPALPGRSGLSRIGGDGGLADPVTTSG
ncbi:hypothetical protein GCM10009733_058080 [Nonomuraea maheshkhaliensis]|uniref:Uncharacterized protein n=1 Tax=Nonomuraea maheshkhaliensis TaxID=419590 RepID=A0ABP4RHN7_9ACTN